MLLNNTELILRLKKVKLTKQVWNTEQKKNLRDLSKKKKINFNNLLKRKSKELINL